MKVAGMMMYLDGAAKSFKDQKGQDVNYFETRFMPMDGSLNPFAFNVKDELEKKLAQIKPYTKVEVTLDITSSKEMKTQVRLIDVVAK